MKRKKLLWTALLACVLIAGCGPAPLDGGGSSIPPADETGTLSDSVYVAHETATIRFVSTIESYCANGIPKTNLYSLAVHYYKHFILGWE